MEPLSRILYRIIKQYGMQSKMLEYNVSQRWSEIVGEKIAGHTMPSHIKYRKLCVLVDSSVWMQELTFLKDRIIEQINKVTGTKLVNDIYFKIAQIETPETQSPDLAGSQDPAEGIKKMEKDLTEEERLLIEECTRPIRDPALRDQVRNTIIKGFVTSKK